MQTPSPEVRASLTRLARSSDRTSPTVFAGREREFNLLNDAVQGAQDGEVGHTVVIQGVPGAGKTALLNEYAARLLAADGDTGQAIVPVSLRPSDLDAPPAVIIQEIDRQFCEFEASNDWRKRMNRMVGGASMLGNMLFAAITKKDFNDFRPSVRAPTSLPVALDDYIAFRFDRRESAIVLLVDEAQSLADSTQVRTHLDALHGGIKGRTQVVLACFGLANTTNRLRQLGLSRLADDHVRSIGSLSTPDARHVASGTLNAVLADFAFHDGPLDAARREAWIGAAADAILAESSNFPHHLTNGCRALAKIALDEGVGDKPPVERLRHACRDHRRKYYDARLLPWAHHMMALAQAFTHATDGWTPVASLKRALMASDDFGDPVDGRAASSVIKEMCANGYVEMRVDKCRPVLPSLLSHFETIRHGLEPHNEVVQAVQAALLHQGRDHPHATP